MDEIADGPSESGPSKPSKVPRLGPASNPIVIPDDEDDLQKILAQIKEQEESEALAKSLQKEWDRAGSSSRDARVQDSDVIMVDSDSEDIDVQEVVTTRAKANGSGKDKGKGKATAHTNGTTNSRSPPKLPKPVVNVKPGEEPPDERLVPFRELFTSSRHCSECNQEFKSPRGDV